MGQDKKSTPTAPPTRSPAAPLNHAPKNDGYRSFSESGSVKDNTVSISRPVPPAPNPPKK